MTGRAKPREGISVKGLDKAISHFGSQERLAKAIGYSREGISMARRRGRTGIELTMLIAAACRGFVTKHDLRPDRFGEPTPHP
jgi:hypothetical protein